MRSYGFSKNTEGPIEQIVSYPKDTYTFTFLYFINKCRCIGKPLFGLQKRHSFIKYIIGRYSDTIGPRCYFR